MIDFNADQARRYMNTMYPNETHSLPGDCINPKCGYHFTDADKESIERNDGWFVCPKCGTTYDYFKDPVPGQGGYTRSGLTMGEMGTIGETIVERMGTIPQLGAISWVSPDYHSPVDLIAGNFGCEIKTNHSEAQARFKVSGGSQVKYAFCQQYGLSPALIGVRLNFYTDKADVFVRPGSFIDTWIGNAQLLHAATVDFSDLNPYKHPEDVPPASQLPVDDSTPPPEEFPF